jgi:hypothetical protein
MATASNLGCVPSSAASARSPTSAAITRSTLADLLAIRVAIDDRNSQPHPTATYSDLYQTSQTPLFGWLTDGAAGPDDIIEEGAWTLTLVKTIAMKRPGRVIPLKMVCTDSAGDELDDGDMAAPSVAVIQVPGGPLPGPFESAGQGTAAGEFVFYCSRWHCNLDPATCRDQGPTRSP